MKKKSILFSSIVIMISIFFIQCSKDDNGGGMEEKGTLAVKVTDAPSDDSNIKGTFVTVADVMVDGKSVEGFTKQTIEISAYQNGEAKLILNNQVEAGAYNSLTLVLDYESDASGNSPGCYVLTDDDQKHDLAASSSASSEINISKEFEIQSNSETSLVVDFDLRKAVVRSSEGSETVYHFVSTTELQSSLRLVNEEKTGEINGSVSSQLSSNNDMYVFAYKKGEFNLLTESMGQGGSNVLFAKAVTSAKVQDNGTYTLAFLEEGDYEIHLASFSSVDEFKTTYSGMLNASSSVSGLLLDSISVSSNTDLELNIEVIGLL